MARCSLTGLRTGWTRGALALLGVLSTNTLWPELALAQEGSSKLEGSGKLEGIKGIAGLGLGYGPTLHAYKQGGSGDLDGPDTFTGFLFALEAGALLNRVELKLEWAPGTYQPLLNEDSPRLDAGKSFYSVVGSVGYYIPITDMVHWPLRIGAGVGSDRNDFIARLDLVNIAVKFDSVLVGVSLPSIRYMSDFDDYQRWTGLFLVSADYVFP